MAIIKGDGYGHGVVETARSLIRADAFAVEDFEEALKLRDAGIRQDTTLLSGFHDTRDLDAIAQRRFRPVLHDQWQVEALQSERHSINMRVWIKIDTGMRRMGFEPSDVTKVVDALEEIDYVRIEGFMSHLANADDPSNPMTSRQCEVFQEATARWSYPRSMANSPGILGWPETHMDWIRPGMMLYGCSPVAGRSELELELQPAMTLESQIIATKTVPAGETIGYGGTWRCESETRVGVLACGYGDGYPRHAPSGTPVWVKGRESRVLGRISMDLMTIDLSGRDDCGTGDWVELWGRNVMASTVAAEAGTIPYELVTRVAARVPRLYE